MAEKIQKVKASEKTEEKVQESTPAESTKREELLSTIDELLDEIDEILEEDAQEFVREYVQKGGE